MRLPMSAVICAAVAAAAIAGVTGESWRAAAYADGGASTRSQATAYAPDKPIRDYALRILRALSDRDANNWVRYWQARADCQAAPAAHDAAPRSRVLLALTASICAQLDALLGVNPAAYSPRGENRTVGLTLNEPGAALGYTLLTDRLNSDIFLLDPLGRVAHIWHMDALFDHAKLLDNGNLLATAPDAVFEFDPRGNIVWQHKIAGRIHHDFLKMPNGNVLLLVAGTKTREEAIAAGANPEFVREDGIKYDYLVEVRPTSASGGEIVWEWSVWDHLVQDFDPSKPNYGAVSEHSELIDINFTLEIASERSSPLWDWTHVNAIDYNPELDQIMLSSRHFSELWIIDHSATTEDARGGSGGNSGMGGDLLYRWGNPRAYDRGDVGDQRFFWQHDTHWIPPGLPGAGNVLAFNNGNEFHGNERRYSSIDEIALPADGYRYRRDEDEAYPPDGLTWTYAPETPTDFYAPIVSGAQRLPNGNTLIVYGTAGTIFQATPDGRIVWKYVNPFDKRFHLRQGDRPQVKRTHQTKYGDVFALTNTVYNAYWHSPDHPGLQALDLTPGGYIEDILDIYDIAHAAAISGDFGDRLARSRYDLYMDEDNRRLIYIKQPCTADEAQPKFFLHIIPTYRQEHDIDNLDFNHSADEVKVSGGRCVAIAPLPRYPISRIRTGQFTDGAGALWQAEVELGE